MKNQWVVVTSQASSRIFERGPRGGLKLISTLDNELVHIRNREMRKHKPGMIKAGSRHHIMTGQIDPHRQSAEQFALKITRFLDKERIQNNFEELVIVAEPRMAGHIKSSMKAKMQKCVSHWIHKDLEKAKPQDLAKVVKKEVEIPLEL